MKRSLQIFFLLISISFIGCVNTRNYIKTKTPTNITATPVLINNFNSLLYNANINFGKKHFSSLFYFKNMPDSSLHIVLLNEMGLNLLDLQYKNNSFKVVSCKDFMNRKIILNNLKQNIKFLIDTPQAPAKATYYKNENNQCTLVKLKHNCKKYYYFYSPDNKLFEIDYKTSLNHTQINVKNNDTIPQNISLTNKKIRFSLELNLLKSK